MPVSSQSRALPGDKPLRIKMASSIAVMEDHPEKFVAPADSSHKVTAGRIISIFRPWSALHCWSKRVRAGRPRRTQFCLSDRVCFDSTRTAYSRELWPVALRNSCNTKHPGQRFQRRRSDGSWRNPLETDTEIHTNERYHRRQS